MDQDVTVPVGVTNRRLLTWVGWMRQLCKPDSVHWCDGSDEEYDRLCEQMVESGTFIRLNPEKRPNSFLARSDPARRRARRGPHLHLLAQQGRRRPHQQLGAAARDERRPCTGLFDGCMRGRTMYVIPFSMGPLGSPIAQIGVQITDSPYVVVNMRIMTRMGRAVLDVLGDGEFVPCMHSVGAPLGPGQTDVPWPCKPTSAKYIVHFPEDARDLVATAPATAATPCSARSASRCASPR